MMNMVREGLRESSLDERFSRKVIERLLARPRPLEIEGHPVRQMWEQIRSALPQYEVIAGSEVAEKSALEDISEDMGRAYHVDDKKSLRTQMTVTTFKAIRGRKTPVRLLAAGRVFRPDKEGPTRAKVFHQADGICIQSGANRGMLQETLRRVLTALFGPVQLKWKDHDFGFVNQGLEVEIRWKNNWLEVAGSGMLQAQTLQKAGYDAKRVGGFAFGLGLERLVMLKFGIEDIRRLWKPPYVPR
jgi:phenylalanyl-tRNA synthetase alpha chain